ncbi:MAG: VWA domain-containing protein [Saprospirales bacterium]|nr:VWA domain-containing protein [Saprospirales bacterium]
MNHIYKLLFTFIFSYSMTLFAGVGLIVKCYVKDIDSKLPVAGAVVSITFGQKNEIFDMTDSTGFYEINSQVMMPEQDYPIQIKCKNYYDLNGFVKVNKTSYRDFTLKHQPKKDTNSVVIKTEPKPILDGFATNNLVFLIDVSSSMNSPEKFPVVKSSLKYLVEQLRPTDRVAILTFSSGVREVLPSTAAENKALILETIEKLRFEGSSQGGAAIEFAYKTAQKNFIKNGNNRIVLATDGLITSGEKEYKKMEKNIEQGATKDITLSMFLFGKNTDYVTSKLKELAKHGNGRFAAVLNIEDAKANMLEEAKAVKN